MCGSSEERQERDTVTYNRPAKLMEKHAGFQWSNTLSEKTCGKDETRTESTSLMKIRKKNENRFGTEGRLCWLDSPDSGST